MKVHELITIPSGTYWIGDPCYTIPYDDWMEWLEAADYTSDSRILEARLSGEHRYAVALNTAYGDGEYLDQNGRNYGVDAGLLGLVSYDWAEDKNKHEEEGTRYLVTFSGPTLVKYDNGQLTFGHIVIETDDLDPDEFEDEGWW